MSTGFDRSSDTASSSTKHPLESEQTESFRRSSPTRRMGKPARLGLVDRLTRTVQGLPPAVPGGAPVVNIYRPSTFSAAHKRQTELVDSGGFIAPDPRSAVWDLAQTSGHTVRVPQTGRHRRGCDLDKRRERHFQLACRAGAAIGVNLIQDFANPSHRAGHHAERHSHSGPRTADASSLAFVNHLAIGKTYRAGDRDLLRDLCRHVSWSSVPERQQCRYANASEDIFGKAQRI